MMTLLMMMMKMMMMMTLLTLYRLQYITIYEIIMLMI